MTAQLRRYQIQVGRVDQFAAGVADKVAPLRQKHGFLVKGWRVEDCDVQGSGATGRRRDWRY